MSSACYVYAIVGRDAPLPPAVDAAGLTMVPWRALAAVARPIANDGAPLTTEAVLHHEAVVEAVRRLGPALPVRFGTVFRDAASVASALAEHYEPLAADLGRLGDKVELSLSALWAAPPSGDAVVRGAPHVTASAAPHLAGPGAGARYLRARAAELRRDEALKERARAVASALEEALGALALDRRVRLLPTPRIAVRAAYLLEPVAVDAFRAAVEVVRGMRGETRMLLTGPWPPYSFVTRPASEGAAASDGRLAALVGLLTDQMRGRAG